MSPSATPTIPDPVVEPGLDPHSFARFEDVRPTHFDLRLDLSFRERAVEGEVEYTLDRRDPDAPLVLDTRGLRIESVEAAPAEGNFRPTAFLLGPKDPILGRSLTVALGDGDARVRIRYRTTDAAGLLWLEPAQTAGKQAPFVFSQSQAILARTFWPCQDTPAVRTTYTATIRVDEDVRVVMAAEALDSPDARPADRTYRFRMDQKVPSYLVAFAAGDLAFAELGSRTGVWAEPATLEAAAYELGDTERMVEAAEALYGPYRWGRYDVLVLPPSFPFGGMENPRLTFATPTILAGDRSLVSLIAHELAHSWSGNLVTNATWEHLWLNEGFTTYFERRIVEALYGPERAEMEAVIGYADLLDSFEHEAKDPALQRLVVDLAGRDPDAGMTQVPYEKGALLLRTLEKAAGREVFDAFLRRWFDEHAMTSVVTDDFAAYLKAHAPASVRDFDLAPWTHAPGVPDGAALPDETVFAEIDRAAAAFVAGRTGVDDLPLDRASTHEWLRFLERIEQAPPDALEALDARFGLSQRGNAEIVAAFLELGLRADLPAARARAKTFLLAVGRRKFLVPIYRALVEAGRADEAEAIYAEAKPGYHALSRAGVEKVLEAARK